MSFPIDTHLRTALGELTPRVRVDSNVDSNDVTDAELSALFDVQCTSRHLDFAARLLQQRGEGFYTIGSAGHESNAVVAMATRPTDPALLHYRSGGFYCARATQVPGIDAVDDLIHSFTSSVEDPISGGRHKVFGRAELGIIPQTSTIASHLPRAMGLAFALGRGVGRGEGTYPADAIVVTSLGDASVNHSSTVGALNAAAHSVHQGVPMPLLVMCEDNGIGISVKTPAGWTQTMLRSWPGIEVVDAAGDDPARALVVAREAAQRVRQTRRPVILHLRTVRFMGHAGSDAEVAYRSSRDIESDYAADPLLATARELVGRGAHTPAELLDRYEATRTRVLARIEQLLPVRRLTTAAEVMAPLAVGEATAAAVGACDTAADASVREDAFRGRLPEAAGALTLAQSINATLADLLAAQPAATVFGEDVGVKGGVYGVTRGLRRAFGATRVFDTLLDEESVLGTALGLALAGGLPIPEIQYLAYLHNAEDQLRGEAATLRFFSDGRYANGMVVRIAGLAYQKGFGGHFHNDNSLAVLLDIPGLLVAVPSSAAEAPGLLRALAGAAVQDSRVGVFVEPIALYHTRDLHPGDGAWTAPYVSPGSGEHSHARLGRGTTHGDGEDVLVVTFGNGVPMSLRAAARVAADGGPQATVLDLRWLAPLPTEHLLAEAARFDRVLVVDETRRSGGVSQAVITALVDGGYGGILQRVAGEDSIIPLGPAANTVLLSEDTIVSALHATPTAKEQS
ncbi:thiamine pyrophosphate-dependent enzyme [Mobilicoccus caccae]|uniref:MFS transporter n=1 Tax=Mobilicoccus caccae TaxID=1859295 RepID=A0ABQ6IWL7_9MICO|nr:thiamine pyrophosphate-dependent enzyme [Mobilicoccus caccae]GMA41981.1 MFS transporter [Mobilicoccus caccae]